MKTRSTSQRLSITSSDQHLPIFFSLFSVNLPMLSPSMVIPSMVIPITFLLGITKYLFLVKSIFLLRFWSKSSPGARSKPSPPRLARDHRRSARRGWHGPRSRSADAWTAAGHSIGWEKKELGSSWIVEIIWDNHTFINGYSWDVCYCFFGYSWDTYEYTIFN